MDKTTLKQMDNCTEGPKDIKIVLQVERQTNVCTVGQKDIKSWTDRQMVSQMDQNS